MPPFACFWRRVAALAAGTIVLVASGCGARSPSPFAQRAEEVCAVLLPGGDTLKVSPATARIRTSGVFLPMPPAMSLRAPSARSKLVPPLGDWLRDSSTTRRADMVVSFTDRVVVPRLPVERLESADSLVLQAAEDYTTGVVDSIRALRAQRYRRDVPRLVREFGARRTRTYWGTQSVFANLPLGSVGRLASRWDVTSIQLVERGAPPPACLDPRTAPDGPSQPCEARFLIGTDPYRLAGRAHGRFALFDTGVWTEHDVLKPLLSATPGPQSHRLESVDCYLDPTCQSGEADDLNTAFRGHGTKSASLLVGALTEKHGDEHRGVTEGWLRAHRVYRPGLDAEGKPTNRAAFDIDGYGNAVEALLGSPVPVVLVEAQDPGGIRGKVAVGADNLFDAGIAVIAPIGNTDALAPGQLGAPGLSARALGVGARPTRTYESTDPYQVFGVADFQRPKPDLQGPTDTQGARAGVADDFSSLPNTSGAAPYAAGAALILRNLLRGDAPSKPLPRPVDPGQLYAAMLAMCQKSRPFDIREGGALFSLPANGRLYWGKTSVSSGQRRLIDLAIESPDARRCRIAIWWPDPRPRSLCWGGWQLLAHHDVDLEVYSPAANATLRSFGADRTFERLALKLAGVPTSPAALQLRLIGRNVGPWPQTVYWAMVVTPQ